MVKQVFLPSFDGYQLNLHIFESNNSPKAVIQFCHGMEEHQERYEPFFKTLAHEGYIVVSNDMRGHGSNAPVQGYFAKKDGDKALIKDQEEMLKFIKENYPTLPRFIFAHSMGTIIMRVYLQKHSSEYSKVVLSGYPNYNPAAPLAVVIGKIVKALQGEKKRSKLLTNLSTGSFNKSIEHPETDLDWLSYNKQNVKKYIEDEQCGIPFTNSAYLDLFKLLKALHNKEKDWENVNPDLKVLFISGKDDPCVGGEEGRKDSWETLKKVGIQNLEHKEYENMRHEMLQEKGAEKVIEDILHFYQAE